METQFYGVVFVALLTAFAVMLFEKIGVREWVQVHGNKFFAKMFGCTFCLCFWVSLIICVILWISSGVPQMLLIPFFSTMLSRFLI